MRYISAGLSYTFACLLLFSCSQPAVEDPAVVKDETEVRRIISVVPSATEMLFAMGVGENVIAVGDYDHFPPEVETRPRIGGLLNPNIEKIIELDPDLVITYGSQNVLRDTLNSRGIQYHPFTHGSIDQTLQYMVDLGAKVGAEPQAREVVAGIRKTFDEVRSGAPARRPKTLLVHNRGAGMLGSLYSVGSRAFQHELIVMAGGENLFGEIDREVIQPSIEEIISRLPDVIIETLPPDVAAEELEQRKRDWQSLKNLPAVRNGRIYILSSDYLLVPGPRLDQAARRFAELLKE